MGKIKFVLIIFLLYPISYNPVYSQNNSDVKIEENTGSEDEVVDQLPEFPGGDKALFDFMHKNVVYPPLAKENGISGKVYVQFVVNTDGSITEVKVLRGIGSGCDEEAVRVVKKMPLWKPGMKSGQPVRCKFVVPFNFKLI